jgi:hypothetical protein
MVGLEEMPEAEFDPLEYHTIADSVVSALLQRPRESLPPDRRFPGAGVYLIYYTGPFRPYRTISKTEGPIYVGKAIPKGSRRGGMSAIRQIEQTRGTVLFDRLRQHAQSIESAENLQLADFQCRYLAVTQIWIAIAESLLIARFHPVWNAAVDGFGLHHPGTTRFTQKRSDWDTLHPGRPWAPSMQEGKPVDVIRRAISEHFAAQAQE